MAKIGQNGQKKGQNGQMLTVFSELYNQLLDKFIIIELTFDTRKLRILLKQDTALLSHVSVLVC